MRHTMSAGRSDETIARFETTKDRAHPHGLAGVNNAQHRLTLKLSGEEKELLTKRYTEDAEAYKLYLNGRYYWNKRTEETIKRAIGFFEQASRADPNFALAYAGLARDDAWRWSPKETLPQARLAAIRALELDDSLAEAHTAMASILCSERDWAGSEREYKRAIELNPNYETAHTFYGLLLMTMERMDEAMAELKQTERLDPLSLLLKANKGAVLFRARAYDQAIEQVRKVTELMPTLTRAHLLLGQIYEQKGMYSEAISEFTADGQAFRKSPSRCRGAGTRLCDVW